MMNFKDDLKTSKLSLDELLCKHNLNLKTAIKKNRPLTKKRMGGATHITKSKGKYQLAKTKDGKSYYLGLYYTLEDAEKVRDKLIEYDWDKDKLEQVLKETGVQRCRSRKDYTSWDFDKVGYASNGVSKKFYLRYNHDYLQIGYFHDFLSCELLYDLIKEELNGG